MPVRRLFLLSIVPWVCVGASVVAQPPLGVAPGAAGPKDRSRLSIVKLLQGGPALVIDYPWKVHHRPSVEIRLVTREDADFSKVGPLWFVSRYLHGTVTMSVYRCLDKAAGVPQSQTLTEDEIEFEILGRRNSLGRPAVCVARRIPNDDPAPGAAAAFCLLPSWSLNKGLLQLQLPPKYFSTPGKLYVWFLRDEKILWEETAEWPGVGKKGMMNDE